MVLFIVKSFIIQLHFFIPILASKILFLFLCKTCIGMTMLHFIFRSESTLAETPGNIERREQLVRATEVT